MRNICFNGVLTPEISKDLEVLKNDDFSLVRFALESRADADVAAYTRGPDALGDLKTYTYGDVKKSARAVAHTLKRLGNIKKGDKILLLQYNSWSFVVSYWAVHYLGAVAVIAIPEHKYRNYLLRYTNCKAVILPEHIWSTVQGELTDTTNVRLVITTDGSANETHTYSKSGFARVADSHLDDESMFSPVSRSSYCIDSDTINSDEYVVTDFHFASKEITAESETEVLLETEAIRRLDECLWYFTSGTTGKPKGCVHSQIDLAYAGMTYGKYVMHCGPGLITATDTLMAGPYAMGSNLIFPFINGGAVILDHIIDQNTNKPQKIISAFDRIDLYVSIPPNIAKITELLDDAAFSARLKKIKIITSAGTNLQVATYKNFLHKARLQGIQTALLDGIGTSELQHIFISNEVGKEVTDIGSIGTVVPGYEAALRNTVDVSDEAGVIGQQGELCIRALWDDIQVSYSNERPPLGQDFTKKTSEVRTTIDGKTFYVTGDLALVRNIDGRDYFFLLGRATELWDQLANEARAVNDFDAISLSNKLMLSAGLFENVSQVNFEIYGQNQVHEPLVSEVFPIRRVNDELVFVVAVNTSHWIMVEHDKNIVKRWEQYLRAKIGTDVVLIFQSKEHIPRTAPPLLKPLGKVMKAFIDNNASSVEDLLELSYREIPKV